MTDSSTDVVSSSAEVEWREAILRRELFRHARGLERLAAKSAQATDFPTATPPKLCRLIGKTAKVIADGIPRAPAEKLRDVHEVLAQIGAHLEIVEQSRISQVPWRVVQATEAYLKRQVGQEFQFVTRPRWDHCHSVDGEFVAAYREFMESLGDFISLDAWEREIGEIRRERIHCISFPRVERINVLLHVNWGRAVGHILAEEWLADNFEGLWLQRQTRIRSAMQSDLSRTGNLPFQEPSDCLEPEEAVSRQLDQTRHVAWVGLRELLCDAVGVHLFGPAAMASLAEHASRFALDTSPLEADGYPPWRCRLRMMSAALGLGPDEANGSQMMELRRDIAEGAHELKPFIDWLQATSRVCEIESDRAVTQADVRSREAQGLIDSHWDSIRADLLAKLPRESSEPYSLRGRLGVIADLVGRLRQGIPPNEHGTWPKVETPSLADIWNAAWACKMCRLEREDWGSPDDCERDFRLVLKAIESVFVQENHGRQLDRGEEP
jgi:hypothetical protein